MINNICTSPNAYFVYLHNPQGHLERDGLFTFYERKAKMSSYESIERCLQQEKAYVAMQGGYLGIKEADSNYNDLNIKLINAFKKLHKKAFLGNVNFDGEKRPQIINGSADVYEEYAGQKLFTSCCSFCVPSPDAVLADLIRKWNATSTASLIEDIYNRIAAIGGFTVIWY